MDHSKAMAEALKWGASFHGQNIGSEVFRQLGQPMPSGTAWCGEFVRDVYLHAGIKTPSNWDSVQAIHDWASGHHLLRSGAAGVQPGDIVGHGFDHTGVVQSVHGNVVTTIAGNAASGGHTVQVQQLGSYWDWHAHMAPAIHGHLALGGAVAATHHVAAAYGGGVGHFHLASLLHGAAVLTSLHYVVPIAVAVALFKKEDEATKAFNGEYPEINFATNVSQRALWKPPGGWGQSF